MFYIILWYHIRNINGNGVIRTKKTRNDIINNSLIRVINSEFSNCSDAFFIYSGNIEFDNCNININFIIISVIYNI